MNYGGDRYKRPEKISIAEETARQEEREAYLQLGNELWRTVPQKQKQGRRNQDTFP